MIQALKQTSQLKLKQYLRILNSLETKRIYSLVKKQAEGNVNRSIHLRKITLKMMIVTEEEKKKINLQDNSKNGPSYKQQIQTRTGSVRMNLRSIR